MLMKMTIAAAMACNVQAWSTLLGTVLDPSNPCMRSCLEILYDSRGGPEAPVEATKSARAQTNAAAKTSKPWSTPHGTVYDPNNAWLVKCREVVHDVTVYDDDTVCLTCMVRIRRQL